jgi:MFS family permease
MVLARLAFGYQLQTVASLGPELRIAFGIEFAVLGTLMGLFQIPGVVLAIPCGFLARRFGDRASIAFGLVLMVVGSLVSAVAVDPFGIGVGRVLSGAGAVALTVLQPKAVADRFTGGSFTVAMGVLVGAFPIGIGLGQLTHGRIAEAFGWQGAFVAGAVLAACACVVFLVVWRDVPGGTSRVLNWPSRRETWLLILAGLIWTGFNAGYFNFLGYLPSLMAARGHPPWMTDAVVSVASWGNLPMMLLGGAIAARLGTVPVFVFGAVLEVISVMGMGMTDWPLLWGTMFGTVASMHAGIIVGWGALSARPENRAVGMGIFYVTYYLGGGLVPMLCGRAADLAGNPSGAFICAGALSALALPFWWLHRRLAAR